MSMVEKVGIASCRFTLVRADLPGQPSQFTIFDTNTGEVVYRTDRVGFAERETRRLNARAAIEALMEPSEDALIAGDEEAGRWVDLDDARIGYGSDAALAIYQAMLTAALEDKTNG